MSVRMSRQGPTFTLNNSSYLLLCPLVPLGWRPVVGAFAVANLHNSDSALKAQLGIAISPTGDLLAQLFSGTVSVVSGDFFHISTGWHY
jgi:hypothetical protein